MKFSQNAPLSCYHRNSFDVSLVESPVIDYRFCYFCASFVERKCRRLEETRGKANNQLMRWIDLIKLVKSYTPLYDPDTQAYDELLIEELWKEVSEQLNAPGKGYLHVQFFSPICLLIFLV